MKVLQNQVNETNSQMKTMQAKNIALEKQVKQLQTNVLRYRKNYQNELNSLKE